ncbi:MAG: FkbM family methyltransferase [Myxococcota bacterium]|nr:FkbM family methyltransferase [Myxococcota bacterium]
MGEPSNRDNRVGRVLLSVGWQVWKRTVRLPIVLTLDNGMSFIAEPMSGNSTGAIYTRIYESIYTEFVRKWVVPGGVLCDVGAHVGLFTLLIAPLFRSGFCFEPAPDTFRLLKRNLALNGLTAFEPRQEAVSSEGGARTLAAEGAYSGGARLTQSGESVSATVRTLAVKAVRLDDVVPHDRELTFLKVDVEGHEPDVLAGAQGTLRRSPRGLVMFEQNPGQALRAVAILREIGWRSFLIDSTGRPTSSLREIHSAYNVFACGPEHPLAVELAGE